MRKQIIYAAALAVSIVTIIVGASTSGAWQIRAQSDHSAPSNHTFEVSTGMIGLTPTQTARLNVVNAGDLPASACSVEMLVFDSEGTVLGRFLGGPDTLLPGKAAGFDFHGHDQGTWDKCGQLPIRSVLRATCSSERARRLAEKSLVLTLQMVNSRDGLTMSILTAEGK